MIPLLSIVVLTLSTCSIDIRYATIGKCYDLAKALNESSQGYILPDFNVTTTSEEDCLVFTNICTLKHSELGNQTIEETYDFTERCRNVVKISSKTTIFLPEPVGNQTISESYDISGGEDHKIVNVSELVRSMSGITTTSSPTPTTIRVILRDGSSGSGINRSIDFWSRIETRSGSKLYTNTNGMLINEVPLSSVCSSSLSDSNIVSVFGEYSDSNCTNIVKSFFVGQVDSECTGVFIRAINSYEHRSMYASGVCTDEALYLSSLYDKCSRIPFNTATSIVAAGKVGTIFMLPNNGTCVPMNNRFYKANSKNSCTRFSELQYTQSICTWRTGYIRGAHSLLASNLTRGECMDHARTYPGFGSWCGVAWTGLFDYEPGACYAVVNDCRGPAPSAETYSQWSCLIQSDHKSGFRENPLFLVIIIGVAFVVCPLCGIVLGITIWRRHTATYQTNLLRAARGVVTGIPLPPVRETREDDPDDCSPVHSWPLILESEREENASPSTPQENDSTNSTDQSPGSITRLVSNSLQNVSIESEGISESNPLSADGAALPEE